MPPEAEPEEEEEMPNEPELEKEQPEEWFGINKHMYRHHKHDVPVKTYLS